MGRTMNELLVPLITLLLILTGISVMFGGPGAAKKLWAVLLAPIGCLLKMAVGVAVLALLGWILLNALQNHLSPEIPQQPSVPMATDPVLLTQYPNVDQRDFANYVSPEFALTHDEETNKRLYEEACLAAVYLMLTRAHSDPNAVLGPAQFNSELSALAPEGFAFERKASYTPKTVVAEIDAGNPVILYADGPNEFTHYVLVVGYSKSRGVFLANDPAVGQRVEFSMESSAPSIPNLPPNTVRSMRLVRATAGS